MQKRGWVFPDMKAETGAPVSAFLLHAKSCDSPVLPERPVSGKKSLGCIGQIGPGFVAPALEGNTGVFELG